MPVRFPVRGKQQRLADAIRVLAMDAVEAASSGHPGMPMGMADIATVLWREFLRHNPTNPDWPDRDRFVVSNGHGSMLLYALLHLSGYALRVDDLRRFRQFGSPTAGHPEHATIGVETTTGPLGQGLANAVGMAMAERNLAREFNRPGLPVVNHRTYAFLGDGCLMEGVSHEACSFAGVQQLGKLICFFDDNGISIDGEVRNWCRDNVAMRFASYHWHVMDAIDGHDAVAVRRAIRTAQKDPRPSLLVCKTLIGYGADKKQGKASSHGAPLGAEEIAYVRNRLNWKYPPFEVPLDIRRQWDLKSRGEALEKKWLAIGAKYENKYPEAAAELRRRLAGKLPAGFPLRARAFAERTARNHANLATRASSQKALNFYGKELPELMGGSADLTGSNLTMHDASKPITAADKKAGNYIFYGVREFGMSAIMNGIALHGGQIPYGGTFLVFSDYARNAVRMAALMRQRVIFVYTHDSIGLGEDGPTHQPVEHLAMLRATPGLNVWRPADAAETAVAWAQALQTDGPSALILSRQSVAPQLQTPKQMANAAKGGYVLISGGSVPDGKPPALLVIATGAEVGLARAAIEKHNAGSDQLVRLISMPCCEVFNRQSGRYRHSVLPPEVTRRLAVEAASPQSWNAYGCYPEAGGDTVCMTDFGASAPASDLFRHYGFTEKNILRKIRQLLRP